MAETYLGYDPVDGRTVLLLIIADVIEELYEDQRRLTDLRIVAGRGSGHNPDYVQAEIDRTAYIRERLERVLWGYDALAEIFEPDAAPDADV